LFVGHLAVALGAKKVEPRAPLGGLVAASFGLDLIWPVLLFAGIEVVRIAPGDTAFTPLAFESYPWSHSLGMVLLWAVLAGLLARIISRSGRVALVVGAVVVSHWVLDFITHRPDLPLWPGGPKVGLGLWNSVPASMIFEGGLLAAAIALYVRSAKPRDAIGRWAFWALIALTVGIWASQPWSTPPPSAMAVASVSLLMWIFPLWAYWIERHRAVPNSASAGL
jgi:membrane-bound metal-dependent hydrolase YbcI (DUF457 family)